jgi:hypothetical protein
MPFEKLIEKENGDVSRIVITNYAAPGAKPDVGVDVFMKKQEDKNWTYLTQSPEERKASMAMGVDDHIKHPMYKAVTNADLLKAGVEAKRFGYSNPHIEATLYIVSPEGNNTSRPVIVSTANGMIEDKTVTEDQHVSADDGSVKHLIFAKQQFSVESNDFQQSRVVELASLQQVATRHLLSVERNKDAGFGIR